MSKTCDKILVIRLSALGDVAMVIPVLYPICREYPQKEFTLLTSPVAAQLYIDTPENLIVKAVDTKKDYKGLKGIFKLFGELKRERFDAVADLHDVLRSKILSLLFKINGVKVATINKGRNEKRNITSSEKRGTFKQLKTSFERYADVFKELELVAKQDFKPLNVAAPLPEWLQRNTTDKTKWIGVAPISLHKGKNYPLERMREVVERLAQTKQYKIFIFGSPSDGKLLDSWQDKEGYIISLCNHKLGFRNEMALMKHLSAVVSMDSANMHIARLVGTPVISIWGATHRYSGFLGWGLTKESVIERNDLECRPCSVFGNRPCKYGDYRCMDIATEKVIEKIKEISEGE